VRAYDPAAGERAADLVPGLEVGSDPYEVCNGAAALALLTEWDEFRWVDFDKVGSLLGTKGIVDARNLLDREALRRKGFIVLGIGRV
jgi:UDPglucose 6-dehydrogenase